MAVSERTECRKHERLLCNVPVTLRLKNQGWEFEQYGAALDFSKGGLRIRTAPALEQGQVVYVLSTDGSLHPHFCSVIWVQFGDPTDRCEAGLEYLPRQGQPEVSQA